MTRAHAGYTCDVNAKRLAKNPAVQRFYAQDICMLSATAAIVEEMERQNVSRVELARRVEKTKGFVSQVLNGSRNMTLRTLADFAWALGLEVHGLRLRPLGTTSISVEAMDQFLDQWPVERISVEHSSTREVEDWRVAADNFALVA